MKMNDVREVTIGIGGAFLRMRRGGPDDVRRLDAFFADAAWEVKEFQLPLDPAFRAQEQCHLIRGFVLLQLAGTLFEGFSDGFREDLSVRKLLDLVDVTDGPLDDRRILAALLIIPQVAAVAEQAMGIRLDDLMNVLAPQTRN
jgi:hypothetical protein